MMESRPRFAGKHFTYPDQTGQRKGEGGIRLRGERKQSRSGEPLVTVITVCFNAAKTLEQCVLSVLAQSYSNLEYIVVDAASADGTLEILQGYADRIDYFVSEPDRGLYHAMNKGVELATGDYILMLNADDWYCENAVAELVAAKRYAGTDFVSALAQAFNAKDESAGVMRQMDFDDAIRLRMPLRHETMLISADIYNAVGGYDESFPIIADYDLSIRIFEAGYSHYGIPRPLLNFRNTGISNTATQKVLAERNQLLRKQFPALSPEQIALLADREHHTGVQLLDLAAEYPAEKRLSYAIHIYVEDNVRAALAGCGRKWWRATGHAHLTSLLQRLDALRHARSPQISIILPVFKGEAALPACIESIRAQTFSDFELICVNDRSPDNSQSIIDEYCALDSRIRSLPNPVNIGHGASRNRGVHEARGTYIFHIDPDDTIPPRALEVLHACATENGSDLVRGAYMRAQFHHGSQSYAPEILYPLKNQRRVINEKAADLEDLVRTPEGHWAFLYRAELARRVPYPRDLKMGQDAIFLSCVLPAAGSISVIPDVVYNYQANAESAMNVFSLRKYMDVLEWRRRALHVLTDYGLRELGVRFVRTYAHLGWHDQFAQHYARTRQTEELRALGAALRAAHAEANLSTIDPQAPLNKRRFLQYLLENNLVEAERHLLALAEGQPESRPKVSVILPFFKAEQTLRQSLESILVQTLREIEVICVNDRSPDGSQAIIDEYREHDPRVVSVINPENIGHGASRNRGIIEADGEYIFHVDPDDSIPPDALEKLYASARKYRSHMTRGAYLHEQYTFGAVATKSARRGLAAGKPPVVNTTLAQMPELLHTTEGHWSYLYKSEFARRVPYPTDLKMGQDSIFIVNALSRAARITLTSDVVYHYHANPDSAMNTFTFRKFMDALEWRRRAWHVLRNAGLQPIGDRLLQAYWADAFFKNLAATLTPDQIQQFFSHFRAALGEAGVTDKPTMPVRPLLQVLFPLILSGQDEEAVTLLRSGSSMASPKPVATPAADPQGLRVATFVSRDSGGAATGTRRRVAALRQHGVNAHIHALVTSGDLPYAHRVVPRLPDFDNDNPHKVWEEVRLRAVAPALNVPGFRAGELFSLPESVVDFRDMREIFDAADIVHMHWVMGMFDYVNAGEVLGKKPMVWTLADMNAFTGGCHYSEGCEEFKRECRNCPLLGGNSDLAHHAWQKKKAAYDELRNLHIVCPSRWLADLARSSSLLGDKPIHHIPNAFPVETFRPTNKTVARIMLGLPLNKRLFLFGAENLKNRRKGGSILRQVFDHLQLAGQLVDVEVVAFGKNAIKLPVRVHSLGHITDNDHLALIYSAVDAFLFPSLEDNAPLTVGESLLCGTPVVTFPVGNVPDLVAHNKTGYIAKYLDIADFARGVEWILGANPAEALQRSMSCRVDAAAFHDPALAAERHMKVYAEALKHD